MLDMQIKVKYFIETRNFYANNLEIYRSLHASIFTNISVPFIKISSVIQ